MQKSGPDSSLEQFSVWHLRNEVQICESIRVCESVWVIIMHIYTNSYSWINIIANKHYCKYGLLRPRQFRVMAQRWSASWSSMVEKIHNAMANICYNPLAHPELSSLKSQNENCNIKSFISLENMLNNSVHFSLNIDPDYFKWLVWLLTTKSGNLLDIVWHFILMMSFSGESLLFLWPLIKAEAYLLPCVMNSIESQSTDNSPRNHPAQN